ncbi:MAG: DNA adenine methylase [Candidatus Methanosuratincola verstraetei]|jgi:DNA adenine methylase|uniref:site-specific DNA-methyltransferase (adenine-specific) n=1 Tax=Candidatus Methanosuratincola petrocarbonis (ex Vanwonterghem et al. 2016) TaxID=1867261 RepID=A0A7J3UXU1_9CREN
MPGNSSSPPIYPFLKWAGGKSQLLDNIVGCMPEDFGTYFEPFLGGGALFFRLVSMGRVRRAILSDLNRDLINCYVVVRDELDALISRLEYYQKYVGAKDFFYEVARPSFNKIRLKNGLEKNVEKAALLIYLNKTCFNGLYRVNSKGEFNVPWGRYDSPSLFDEANLRAVSRALDQRWVEIMCCDYREAVKLARAGDLVYFDPPYQPLSRTSSFTQYTPDSFSEEDQRALAEAFRDLDGRGCKVVMSNSSSPLVEGLYRDYISRGQFRVAMAARAISCLGDGRGRIPEYIIFNYPMPRNQ